MFNPNTNFNDNSGILTSKEIMSKDEKLTFFRKLLNVIALPTLTISRSLNNNTIDTQNLALVMQVFSSIHIDSDLFNLSIIEDNINTKILQSIYDRNKFYMISSEPVLDKVTKDITILFTFHKNLKTKPVAFLDELKKSNHEILGFLYLKELIGLSMKNYKNKFILANKARMQLMQNNANMDGALRDQAAISLSKMAIEFHVNSMIIDNFDNNAFNGVKSNNNINYLKDNPFILYDSKYNYKMTQLDILNELLNDAVIDYVDSCDMNEFNNNLDENNITNNENDENNNCDDSLNINESTNNENNDENNDENKEIDYDDLRNSPFANNMQNGNNTKTDNDATKFIKITFKSNNNKIFFMKMPPQKPNDRYDSLDYCDEKSIENMQTYIDVGLQKLKGTGLNGIFERLGAPIKMDIPWEKDYIRFVENNTFATNSVKTMTTWSKINMLTRHIAHLPGKVHLPESFPTLYVIFDQSGSMSNNAIQKINYIIYHFYNQKYDVNVLIHDWAQTADEVDVYELRPRNKLGYNDNFMINDLINSRIRAGGTSHKGVFDLMEVYIKDVTAGNKKYSIQYPLICSDLESDIESIYKNYEWIRLLNNNIRAVTTDNEIELPFGKTYHCI